MNCIKVKYIKKKNFQASLGSSWIFTTKLLENETVSMEELMKICKTLNCNFNDIMEPIPKEAA